MEVKHDNGNNNNPFIDKIFINFMKYNYFY